MRGVGVRVAATFAIALFVLILAAPVQEARPADPGGGGSSPDGPTASISMARCAEVVVKVGGALASARSRTWPPTNG